MSKVKEQWSIEDWKEYQKSGKKPEGKASKYGNKKTTVDDEKFDSQKEARRWGELKIKNRAGLISKPIRQYAFELPGGIEYRADFVYFDYLQKKFIVEDTKGVRTDVYIIKKKLLLEACGLEILET